MIQQDSLFDKCPAENTPEFKACKMCEECAILKAWKLEQKSLEPNPIKRNKFLINTKELLEYLISFINPFRK